MPSERFLTLAAFAPLSLGLLYLGIGYLYKAKINLFLGISWLVNFLYMLVESGVVSELNGSLFYPIKLFSSVYSYAGIQSIFLWLASRELSENLRSPYYRLGWILPAGAIFVAAALEKFTAIEAILSIPVAVSTLIVCLVFVLVARRAVAHEGFGIFLESYRAPEPTYAFEPPWQDEKIPKARAELEKYSRNSVLGILSAYSAYGILQICYPVMKLIPGDWIAETAFFCAVVLKAVIIMSVLLLLRAAAISREIELRRGKMQAEMEVVMASLLHEIASPIENLRSIVESVDSQDPLELKSDLSKTFRRIQTAVDLILLLREQAKDYAAGRLPHCDVNQVINSALGSVKRRVLFSAKAVRFELNLGRGLPLVVGRFERLEQAITNVIKNAMEAAHQAEDSPLVLISTRRVGKNIEISIQDNGEGIKEENLARIFNPTFSTKRGEDGKASHGMGLYITQRIVTLHNGAIWPESKTGETVFLITLPVATARLEPKEKKK